MADSTSEQHHEQIEKRMGGERETLKAVSHVQTTQLLHNKFVVVLGDSIQRGVYKDLVVLLQKEKFLSQNQLKNKGEMSFEQDCLVEGGCLDKLHNGIRYREVRQFQSDHHLVRFYFVTRIYSQYIQSILEDFRHGLKPDLMIVNSCLWDISRYNSKWTDEYKENLHHFFDDLQAVLPKETLIIWNLTMPLGERIRGGFLVPEIEHKASHLRYDVIEANFYSGTLASAYGLDVLDLHFQFRLSLQHRVKDGVHWDAIAHRKITCLLLQHAAQAWGVILPCAATVIDENTDVKDNQPANNGPVQQAARKRRKVKYLGYKPEFSNDFMPDGYLSFEDFSNPRPRASYHGAALNRRPVHIYDFNYGVPYHFGAYEEHRHQHIIRNRHTKQHYVPYTHHRPMGYPHHGYYY
ncbi:PC-esterase domain-containing protein 1A [Pholidichthys leucotaenia]